MSMFDVPCVIELINQDQYRVHIGSECRGVIPSQEMTPFPVFYQITGPFEVYFTLKERKSVMTQRDIHYWFVELQRQWCEIKVMTIPLGEFK